MSDTIRWMRLWLALAVATLGACSGDPTLEVVVTHATGPTVKYTTVTVYQSESLTCEDVEFARLDAVQLEALEVADETIDDAGAITGELTGMSRTENKVIVARDFDATDTLVAINCAQKGEVIGKDKVEITTIIAAQVSLKPPVDPGDLAVAVLLTNSKGTPISDARPVSWTVYGPLGSVAANPSNVTPSMSTDGDWQPTKPTCSDNGIARLHPNPPNAVGGYAVQVRPAWAVALPPLYTSLTAPGFGIDPKPKAANTLRHYCAIQRKGSLRHVVCVDNVGPKSFQYTVTTANGAASLSADSGITIPNFPVAQNAIGVVAVSPSSGSTDRDVYVVTDRGVLVPVYGAPPPIDQNPLTLCPSCVDDAIAVPPCGLTKGKILFHTTVGATVREIDAHGGNEQSFTVPSQGVLNGSAALDNAGCVDVVSSTGTAPAQFATVHFLNQMSAITASYLVACGNMCAVALGSTDSKPITLTRGASVGFSPDNRMIATTVDATGVVLARVKFAQNNGVIEEPPRMSAVAAPEHVVTGKFDGDTNLGTVWDVSARTLGTSFEIAYHKTIGNTGAPVEALSALQAVNVANLDADDLDGDGFDDLLITTTTGIAIVPLASSVAIPANSDATCMP